MKNCGTREPTRSRGWEEGRADDTRGVCDILRSNHRNHGGVVLFQGRSFAEIAGRSSEFRQLLDSGITASNQAGRLLVAAAAFLAAAVFVSLQTQAEPAQALALLLKQLQAKPMGLCDCVRFFRATLKFSANNAEMRCCGYHSRG